MVVGTGSESYRTLRYLVERLPAMIAPGWLKVPTQPIAIDDVLGRDGLYRARDGGGEQHCADHRERPLAQRHPARNRRMRVKVPKPPRTFLEMDEPRTG